MRFAIVSDTHDNIKNFNKIISFLNKEGIDTMLHCGDICHDAIMNDAKQHFQGDVHYVRGNGDFHLDHIPEKLELELGQDASEAGSAGSPVSGKKVFMSHYPDIAKQAAESGKYDLVFYGHTHRPWEEKILVPLKPNGEGGGTCRLINPGEVAGQRYKPTFAIYDTKTEKLELKILEKLELDNG